jgi:hypothetical protein
MSMYPDGRTVGTHRFPHHEPLGALVVRSGWLLHVGLSSAYSGVVGWTACTTHGSCVRERLRRPDIVR